VGLFASGLDAVRLWGHLAGASVRSQMQYRVAFLLRSATDACIVFSDFLPIWFLVHTFGGLQGWTLAELALLYGMVGVSWAPVEGVLRSFENFGVHLLRGDLDRWLLRPRGIVLQVGAHEIDLRKGGRLAQALVVLAIAAYLLGLGPASLGWVALGIFGGMLFFAGVVLLGAASLFWTLGQTAELQNILTYGGSATLAYPVSIYSRWFRRVITFGIPLAFVNYFPALAALDRTAAAGWPAFLPWLSPLVCGLVFLAGRAAFARGLLRYESTGT
jgi:ABC-2 type transport system permease protein